MNVQNRRCIRRLSFRSLWASRKRNIIAVIAIALTTLLFTSLFTIAFSMNSSYETYLFRQVGGYNHGTFKEVSEEQMEEIQAHPKIRAVGRRQVAGTISSGVFGKIPAEVSYMDSNNTKWGYCVPTVGREPAAMNEITMDTKAMELLGLELKLNQEVELTFDVGDKNQNAKPRTDTFQVVGYWEYDEVSPVHFLNISKEYAEFVEEEAIKEGCKPFRDDLNIMLKSSLRIRETMEEVANELGYQLENPEEENYIRIGVNWGYTSSQLASEMDMGTVLAILAFLVLILFTGYLIIYNIFQISVTGDIRFYGLLKTIGVTPRQLRRIIYQQAGFLCLVGIPLGLVGGYAVGTLLTPYVLRQTTILVKQSEISTSPLLFLGSILFSLVTVFLSCRRPGRFAGRVSPIEATKYTEVVGGKKKRRRTQGAKVYQMAFANLGRNKKKTILVILSLSLSMVLLNFLYTFTGGFDMEKFLDQKTCADFIVGKTGYFRFEGLNEETHLEDTVVSEIEKNTEQTVGGRGYAVEGHQPKCWLSEEAYRAQLSEFVQGEALETSVQNAVQKDNLWMDSLRLEGLDRELFDKIEVKEGNLAPLFEEDTKAIAIALDADDYGRVKHLERYPAVGDTLKVTYIEELSYVDGRTGEPSSDNTPEEFIESKIEKSHDVEYTVCALVLVPYSMSFRFSGTGYDAILPVEKLSADSGRDTITEFYLFDTPDQRAEEEAEEYLAKFTEGDTFEIMYESKKIVREDFQGFQKMFVLLGGLFCFIIGLVGVLNFFNAIMTGILARRHEFAVLQSIGLTNRQLKNMLIYEGLCYTLGSVFVSFLLSLFFGPMVGSLMEKMFWFFTYRFTMIPIFLLVPIFAFLGWMIPVLLYHFTAKYSVIERLREATN